MKKHPGTSGLMPVKGSGCGIRPDPESLTDDIGFDFSEAKNWLKPETDDDMETNNKAVKNEPGKSR